MKTMLRKSLALFLCLVMCLSLFPATAFAEGEIAEEAEALEPVTLSESEESQLPTEPEEEILRSAQDDTAEEPVAEEPAVEEPAVEEPAVEEPVAEEPTAEEPVAEEPAAEEPAVEEPTVEELVAEEPIAEEPAVEEPTVEELVAEEPIAEEPAVEEPVAEEPAVEEPVVEEPIAEEPAVEEPVAEEPAAEEPAVEEPVAEEPIVEEPAEEEPVQELSYIPGGAADNAGLLDGYARAMLDSLRPSGDGLLNIKDAGSRLTGLNKAVYDALRPLVAQVAAGERSSTSFSFSASGEGSLDLDAVIDALLADCPYELYWYDKTRSTGGSVSGTEITLNFPVAQEYAAGEYEVDPSYGATIRRAVDTAAQIVSDYSGASDYDKLLGYKNEICDRVSYNHDAVNNNAAYGNPWQLIWIFDGDESTNVVCEGYSKGFQYLCDLTGFAGAVTVYSVTGTMNGGTGAGGHMWNLVTMENGKNYMVDVTNCDSGSVGYPNELFLAGYASGSAAEGYVFSANGSNITYTYDSDMSALFGADSLEVSEYSYLEEPAGGDEPEPDGEITWYVQDGVLYINGSGELDYVCGPGENGGCPWKEVSDTFTSAVIGEGITGLYRDVFAYCNRLVSIHLPASLSYFSEFAIDYCGSIREITVAAGNETFCSQNGALFSKDMHSLVRVPPAIEGEYTVPDGVLYIRGSAFEDCSLLTGVTIPASVTSIDIYHVFRGCESLTNLYAEEGGTYTSVDGVLFIGKTLAHYPTGRKESYTVPTGTERIREYAFSETEVTRVVIPETVTEIGSHAFSECNELTEAVLPDSLTEIQERLFRDCYKLSAVVLPAETESVGECAFEGCRALTDIAIPERVKTIGGWAFSAAGLTSLYLPGSVTDIGYAAFSCESLRDFRYGGTEEQWAAMQIGEYNEWLIRLCPFTHFPVLVLDEEQDLQFHNDYVYLKYTPEQSGTYTLTATCGESLWAYLYDSAWNRIEVFGDYSDGRYLMEVQLQAGETYYFALHASASESSAAFEAVLSKEASPEVLPLALDTPATAEITEAGGYAYFSFTPEETGRYEFTSNADNDTCGYLYDADWVELQSDDDGGEGNNFRIRYLLNAGETYYFGARYFGSEQTGSFPVTLTRWQVPETTPITIDTPVTAEIAEAGGSVYFRFTAEEAGNYTFRFSSAYDSSCTIYDADWNGTDWSGGVDYAITRHLYAGELRYIGVQLSDSSLTGSVTVSLSFVAPVSDLATLRAAIEAGETSIYPETEQLLISEDFTIPEGVFVGLWNGNVIVPEGVTLTVAGSLNAYTLQGEGTAEITGTLWTRGNSIHSINFSADAREGRYVTADELRELCEGVDPGHRLMLHPVESEQFYIDGDLTIPAFVSLSEAESLHLTDDTVVTNYGSISARGVWIYGGTLINYGSISGSEGVRGNIVNHGHITVSDISIADAIALIGDGTLDYGFIYADTDISEDVTIPAGMHLSRSFYNDEDERITIPEGVTVVNNGELDAYSIELNGTLINNGTLRLSNLFGTGSYTNNGTDEITNNSLFTYTVLTLDVPASAEVGENSGEIYFSFTPEESGRYTFASASGSETYGYLYNSWRDQLMSVNGIGIKLSYELSAGETYYFGIQYSAPGTYQVAVTKWQDPASTPLALDTPATAEIAEAGGYAYFRFTPEETGRYEFTSNADSDTYGYLYDADWNELQSNDDGGEGNNFRIQYTLNAGETYYFGARYYSSELTGSFPVTLRLVVIPRYALTLGEELTLHFDSNNREAFCTFTPTESGWYGLRSNAEIAVRIQLYNEESGSYEGSTSSGFSPDFVKELTAGESYTYSIQPADQSDVSDFACTVCLLPTGNPQQEFASFAELQAICAGASGFLTTAKYTGTEPMTVTEDLRIPAELSIWMLKGQLIVPAGVTLTVEAEAGLYAHSGLELHGSLSNAGVTYVRESLAVDGTLENTGDASYEFDVSSLEELTAKREDNGFLYRANLRSSDSIRIAGDYEIPGYVNLSVDRGEAADTAFIVESGAELTVYGKLLLSIPGKIEGTLRNEGLVEVKAYRSNGVGDGAVTASGSLERCAGGVYTGSGRLAIFPVWDQSISLEEAAAATLTGFSLDEFIVSESEYGAGGGWYLQLLSSLPELSLDTPVSLTLAAGEHKALWFTAPETDVYDLRLESGDGETNWELHKPNGDYRNVYHCYWSDEGMHYAVILSAGESIRCDAFFNDESTAGTVTATVIRKHALPAQEIAYQQRVEISGESEYAFFRFTPDESKEYRFLAESEALVICSVFDESWDMVTSSDWYWDHPGTTEKGFDFSYALEEGRTYSFGLRPQCSDCSFRITEYVPPKQLDIHSFAELKAAVEAYDGNDTYLYYNDSEPFVIEESITLPGRLYFCCDAENSVLRIPEGVTLRVEATGSNALYSASLVLDGVLEASPNSVQTGVIDGDGCWYKTGSGRVSFYRESGLHKLCARSYDSLSYADYEGSSPLEIHGALTVPEKLTVLSSSGFVVAADAELTVNGGFGTNGGEEAATQVDGRMTVNYSEYNDGDYVGPMYVDLGRLQVTGSLTVNTYMNASEVNGREHIEFGENAWINIEQSAQDLDMLQSLLDRSAQEEDHHFHYDIMFHAAQEGTPVVLDGDTRISSFASLSLYEASLEVPAGVTLYNDGFLNVLNGTLKIEGSLVNEGTVQIKPESFTLSPGSYSGKGTLLLESDAADEAALAAELPNLDLSLFDEIVHEGWGWRLSCIDGIRNLADLKEAIAEFLASGETETAYYYLDADFVIDEDLTIPAGFGFSLPAARLVVAEGASVVSDGSLDARAAQIDGELTVNTVLCVHSFDLVVNGLLQNNDAVLIGRSDEPIDTENPAVFVKTEKMRSGDWGQYNVEYGVENEAQLRAGIALAESRADEHMAVQLYVNKPVALTQDLTVPQGCFVYVAYVNPDGALSVGEKVTLTNLSFVGSMNTLHCDGTICNKREMYLDLTQSDGLVLGAAGAYTGNDSTLRVRSDAADEAALAAQLPGLDLSFFDTVAREDDCWVLTRESGIRTAADLKRAIEEYLASGEEYGRAEYRRDEAFVIDEDITIPENFTFDCENLVVAANASLTVNGSLYVRGSMRVDGAVTVGEKGLVSLWTCAPEINGSAQINGRFYVGDPSGEGADWITEVTLGDNVTVGENGTFGLMTGVKTEEDLRKVLAAAAQADSRLNYGISILGELMLTQDLTIPANASISLSPIFGQVKLSAQEGVTIHNLGRLNSIVDLDLSGSVRNDGEIYVEGKATLRCGSYGGSGLLRVQNTGETALADRLSGAALEAFDIRETSEGGLSYWELQLKRFTVSYDANGGTNAPAAQEKLWGDPLTLSTGTPERENAEFLGWAEDSTAEEPRYQPGDSYTAEADVTLYAVWKEQVPTGWQEIDGQRYYYDETGKPVTGWQKLDGKWYYFAEGGAMVTGWQKIAGKWYYFNAGGAMVTGWQRLGGKWYYFNASGAMVTGWQDISGKRYYFEAGGAMVTGWQELDGQRYYFDNGGAMSSGWQEIENVRYYFAEDGAMQTGWQKLDDKWYYFAEGGAMLTGWQKISNKWYYFNAGGDMVTGWKQISGKWYYFNAGGDMVAGWKQISGKWYYFNAGGDMVTGWKQISGKWYYFEASGVMLTSTSKTISGKTYNFDANGVCTNP